jgi:acid phosphatase (class A)
MRYGSLVFSIALLSSVSAQAGLLAPSDFEAGRFLPPPPAPDSVQTKAEMQELHDIAARSTDEERVAAAHDAKDETADMFNAAIGMDLKTMPETFKLLTLVGDEEEDDTKGAKAWFHRDRPYSVESSLKTCTPVKPGKAANSYPSGHSTRAFAMGEVLAALMPVKAQAILARSSEYAEHRLVCGVHYRSDIVAGQQYGTILALKLMENDDFKKQMTAARHELSAAQR